MRLFCLRDVTTFVMDIKYASLYFVLYLLQFINGGEYTFWICGARAGSGWTWQCGLEMGQDIETTFVGWSEGSDPQDLTKDALAMDDEGDFLYTPLKATDIVHRTMCEVRVLGDCPDGWGRIIYQSDSCWQLIFYSTGYSWSEANQACRDLEVLDAAPYLCVISSVDEYEAIRSWLSPLLPPRHPVSTTAHPENTTQYETTTWYVEPKSNAETTEVESTTSRYTILRTETPHYSSNRIPHSSRTTPYDHSTPQSSTTTSGYRSSIDFTSTEDIVSADFTKVSLTTSRPTLSETSNHVYEEPMTSVRTGSDIPEVRPLLSLYIDNSVAPKGIEHLNPDKRAFAIGVGVLAILLMVGLGIFICLMDAPTFVRDLKKGRRNIQHFLKSKKIKGIRMC